MNRASVECHFIATFHARALGVSPRSPGDLSSLRFSAIQEVLGMGSVSWSGP